VICLGVARFLAISGKNRTLQIMQWQAPIVAIACWLSGPAN
jgi:hypothetical protein